MSQELLHRNLGIKGRISQSTLQIVPDSGSTHWGEHGATMCPTNTENQPGRLKPHRKHCWQGLICVCLGGADGCAEPRSPDHDALCAVYLTFDLALRAALCSSSHCRSQFKSRSFLDFFFVSSSSIAFPRRTFCSYRDIDIFFLWLLSVITCKDTPAHHF